jgi:hypothetical protein
MPEEGVALTPNAEVLTLDELAKLGSFFAQVHKEGLCKGWGVLLKHVTEREILREGE